MKLRSCFLLLLLLTAGVTHATSTYDGTEGLGATVFSATGGQYAPLYGSACAGCHATGNGVYAELDTWTKVNAYAGASANCVTAGVSGKNCIAYRIANNEMPSGDPLDATGKSKVSSWQASGFPQYATPQVFTSAEDTPTKYSVGLNALVQENGLNTNFDFQWGTTTSYLGGNTTDQSPTGTGGDNTWKSITATLTGLSCGTTYHYRVRSITGTYAQQNGSDGSFTTATCPSIAGIPDRSVALGTSITEDQSLSYNVSGYVSGTITNPAISYSLTTAPAGMTINSSTGLISWSAANVPDSPTVNTNYTVTVQITDGTTTSSDTFLVTVTPVNDAPVISTAVAPSTGAVEGVAYSYDVNATDVDSTVVYSLNAAAISAGMVIDSSGVITWTPVNGGPSSVAVVATAGENNGALTDTLSWTVNVTATNNPPEIVSFSPTLTGSEDVQWSYQLTVSDIDDDESTPGNIFYTLGNAPTGMSVSNLGLITWTPTEAQVADTGTTQFSNITITVEDGNEDVSTPTAGNNGVKTFTLTISPVNDPPVLASLPDRTVTELSAMSSISAAAVTYFSDPDDSSGFTWSLSNQPTGMSIDASGVITYTPGQDVVPSNASSIQFSVTVNAFDPDLATDTDVVVVTVNKKDADSDLIADYHDNCLNTANNDQADNDADGVAGGAGGSNGGDVCDTDDDNDGITDVAEIANGLDPFDAADAAGDLDGDGVTNLAEFLVCVGLGDASCTDIGNSLVTNGDIEVVATGYYTPVELSATAITIESGNVVELDVSVDNPGPFRPGVHVLTWTATHPVTAAVLDTEQQTVTVIPTVSLGGTVYSGEGRTVNLQVQLNGESPEYPVYVDYTVSGTATGGNVDHDLAAGTVKITAGTSELLPIAIVDDGIPEGDETVVVTLTGISSTARSGALSDAVTGTLVIADRQLAPEVMVWVEQDTGAGNERRTVLYRDQNKAYVDLIAVDPNGDALGWDWSASDPALALGDPTLVNTTPVAIDPSSLTAGETYDLVVSVSDGNGNIVERRVSLSVADTAPTLASVDTDGDGLNDDDLLEGTADSDGDGLLNYLDAITAPDILPVRSDGSETGFLRVVQAGAGYSIELGQLAIAAQDINLGVGAQVPSGGVVDGSGNPVPDTGYSPVGALYDVIVGGARDGQGTVQVAYSLVQPLPPQSTWRVFINGAWFTFAVTASDTLWSAPTDASGQCPSPDAAGWQAGLVTGSGCVRLVLSDGGPNDADGVVNGSVQTTGGAAIPPEQADAAAPDSEQGGTTHLLFLVLLALAGFRTRRSGK